MMKQDLKKIIVSVAFVIGVIGFNTIKKTTQYQISKGINLLCKNSQDTIIFNY
jgi:hypothetical protein